VLGGWPYFDSDGSCKKCFEHWASKSHGPGIFRNSPRMGILAWYISQYIYLEKDVDLISIHRKSTDSITRDFFYG
jgi:hypothetical protein